MHLNLGNILLNPAKPNKMFVSHWILSNKIVLRFCTAKFYNLSADDAIIHSRTMQNSCCAVKFNLYHSNLSISLEHFNKFLREIVIIPSICSNQPANDLKREISIHICIFPFSVRASTNKLHIKCGGKISQRRQFRS